MSCLPELASSLLIRNRDVVPRTDGLLAHVRPGLQQELATLAGDIWQELLQRFATPLSSRESVRRRTVTVLGAVRYVVSRRSGLLTLEQAAPGSNGRRSWRRARFTFAADLPFMPSPGLFEELLGEWAPQLAALARSPADIDPLTTGLAVRLRKAALSAIDWKRLRHTVRAALALDPEVLDLARRSRVNAHGREVTDGHYNRVVTELAAYRQVRADNPNLLWLFALAQAEKVDLPHKGEALAKLRTKILSDFSLPPAAWCYLANGRRRDFRLVLDWLGPHAQPNGRWSELREWLRVLVALEPEQPVPLPVQRLFLHDAYRMDSVRQSLLFRGATLSIATLRTVVGEAETQLARGTLRTFAEDELPDVLAWLSDVKPALDERQQKAGWPYLLRHARDWKHDRALRENADSQSWISMINEYSTDGLTVRPITDVWQLHREALGMRNCTNVYLGDCLAGTVRLFAVLNACGKQVGTVGLTRQGRQWKVLDVRGFANAAPLPFLRNLADTLAARYTTLWLALHPLLAQGTAVPASVPVRDPEPFALPAGDDSGNCIDDGDDGDSDGEWWSDEDDGMPRHVCPICGNENLDCEHLVAAIDHFNGGVYAGSLYRWQELFVDHLSSLVTRAAATGKRYSGVGKPVDNAIAALRDAGDDGESAERAREENEWALINHLYETLETVPGIETDYWEFDGGAPGTSTCGRNFWATDVEVALERLAAKLGLPGAATWKARSDARSRESFPGPATERFEWSRFTPSPDRIPRPGLTWRCSLPGGTTHRASRGRRTTTSPAVPNSNA